MIYQLVEGILRLDSDLAPCSWSPLSGPGPAWSDGAAASARSSCFLAKNGLLLLSRNLQAASGAVCTKIRERWARAWTSASTMPIRIRESYVVEAEVRTNEDGAVLWRKRVYSGAAQCAVTRIGVHKASTDQSAIEKRCPRLKLKLRQKTTLRNP